MRNLTARTPFLQLLIPVVAGIVANEFIPNFPSAVYWGTSGVILMLLAFFLPKKTDYSLRWIFGVGIFALVFAITTFQYQQKRQQAAFDFPPQEQFYKGFLFDIPVEKSRSIRVNVQLTYPVNKKIVLYIEKKNDAYSLQPGNEILFSTKMQPFKNTGNPDEFDYKRFMQLKGFAASAYISHHQWQKTGNEKKTLYIRSQKWRAKALDFYKSFGLSTDEYAFISALTLGYKAALPNEMIEAFNATGTAHVLAVSGLHVGIIYLIIVSLLSFLGSSGNGYITKQLLVILILWGYAFFTGLPVSVIRAAIMLTVFCLANTFYRKGFSYNSLAIAAFFILIFKPMSLFEVGFQLSFSSVFAILFFKSKMDKLYTPKNKITNFGWNLFTISFSAQLGVFPLVLHYFGTFPTYFFITNVLVIPLIGVVIYVLLPVIIFGVLSGTPLIIFNWLFVGFAWVLKLSIRVVLHIVYFFETLPFAQFTDRHTTVMQTFLLFVLVFAVALFIEKRRFSSLSAALTVILMLLLTQTWGLLNKEPDKLVIYNRTGLTEINYVSDGNTIVYNIPANGTIPHPSKKIVRLSDNVFRHKTSDKHISVDYLILSEDGSFSMNIISTFFTPETVILDSSFPRNAAMRITNECRKMGIKVRDVAQTGAFSVNL